MLISNGHIHDVRNLAMNFSFQSQALNGIHCFADLLSSIIEVVGPPH